jgi:hypothetical protein
MPFLLDQSRRTLKCLFLALIVLFAQQAAQLHALAHAEDQLAQPQKGKAATHPIEQCIAFHAVGSALTATVALQDFATPRNASVPWFIHQARASSIYRLPVRAPPQAV